MVWKRKKIRRQGDLLLSLFLSGILQGFLNASFHSAIDVAEISTFTFIMPIKYIIYLIYIYALISLIKTSS